VSSSCITHWNERLFILLQHRAMKTWGKWKSKPHAFLNLALYGASRSSHFTSHERAVGTDCVGSCLDHRVRTDLTVNTTHFAFFSWKIWKTFHNRGFAHRGFAYWRKNYCGDIYASRCRLLAVAQARGVIHNTPHLLSCLCRYRAAPSVLRLYFSQFLESIIALAFRHSGNFQPGKPTTTQ
jgi:hypothetical protein